MGVNCYQKDERPTLNCCASARKWGSATGAATRGAGQPGRGGGVRPPPRFGEGCRRGTNLMPLLVEAARARATLGEITDSLRSVFGPENPPLSLTAQKLSVIIPLSCTDNLEGNTMERISWRMTRPAQWVMMAVVLALTATACAGNDTATNTAADDGPAEDAGIAGAADRLGGLVYDYNRRCGGGERGDGYYDVALDAEVELDLCSFTLGKLELQAVELLQMAETNISDSPTDDRRLTWRRYEDTANKILDRISRDSTDDAPEPTTTTAAPYTTTTAARR